jgi:hypothetical protein
MRFKMTVISTTTGRKPKIYREDEIRAEGEFREDIFSKPDITKIEDAVLGWFSSHHENAAFNVDCYSDEHRQFLAEFGLLVVAEQRRREVARRAWWDQHGGEQALAAMKAELSAQWEAAEKVPVTPAEHSWFDTRGEALGYDLHDVEEGDIGNPLWLRARMKLDEQVTAILKGLWPCRVPDEPAEAHKAAEQFERLVAAFLEAVRDEDCL